MAESDPIGLINDMLLADFISEQTGPPGREGMRRIDEYYHGQHDDQFKPHDPSLNQYRALMERSKLNLLDLVVKTRSQVLYADGYRSNDPDATNAQVWEIWNNSRWDSRQSQVWDAALAYGVAYATVLMGHNAFSGKDEPVLTAYSPRRMMAWYEDPANDEWPEYALIVKNLGDRESLLWGIEDATPLRLVYLDDTFVIEYRQGVEKDTWVELSRTAHGAGVCPVIRYCNDLDLDGRYYGEVEPLVPAQDRLNQSMFDLIMMETFNSFKVRWVSGVMLGDVDEEGLPCNPEVARQNKLRLAQDSFLAFPDADTKVGSLDETSLAPMLNVAIFNIRTFAIKSQTPPQNFLGDIGGNIAADALSALESSAAQKTRDRQRSFGESIGQMLRLAAKMAGIEDEATDYSLMVSWADAETRSLAQIADAWGKIAVMMQVPVEETWEQIPGIDLETVQRWKEAKKKADAKALAQGLAGGANGQGNQGGSGGANTASSVVQPTAGQLASPSGASGGATASGAERQPTGQ